MILIKALLAGMTSISLCTATISGIITDTGSTPVAGAAVQLERGGQTAISGTDGNFTIAATAILHGNGTLLPNGLSARISGNMLNVTITERSAVEVMKFDLNGKSLSTMCKTLDAGSHSISLPYRSAGIYLYKVKTGDRELVLKSNTTAGSTTINSLTAQSTSTNPSAKLLLGTAAINDVIAVTKTGYLNYRVVVYNPDTSGIVIKLIVCAGTVTDADGNVYQTVKIGNQEWMAENLRTTKYRDGTAIPIDTSIVTWAKTGTPKFCYYGNTINADSIKKFGALYNGYVVDTANEKKIAPAGWHVPTDAEWDTLQNYLVANGYNWDGTITGNKIAKSLASKADWYADTIYRGTVGADLTKNNASGFTALPGGFGGPGSYSNSIGSHSTWWSASYSNRSLYYDVDYLYRESGIGKNIGFSVRLVRD